MKRKTALARCGTLLILFFFITTIAFSQNTFRVSGKVSDETGKPVSGATVQVKGTTITTTTNSDGYFVINTPSATSKLVITSIGFLDQEIDLDNRNEISITATSSTLSMEEVVVTGYATVKKKDVTGAVASIGQKDIRARPVDNVLQAMQGKLSGVDITSNERPGTVPTIRIRGERSVNATNDPLYVVDNIPLSSGGIEYLNPNDI